MGDNFEGVTTIGGKKLSQQEAEIIQAKRDAVMRGEIADIPPTRTLQPAPRPPKTVKVPGRSTISGDESPAELHKEANLKMLRDARRLVENDQLDGLIIIGRQKNGQHFLTDHALDRRIVSHNDLYAFVGVLDTLKRELGDITLLAPCLLSDGTIADPHAQEGPEFA